MKEPRFKNEGVGISEPTPFSEAPSFILHSVISGNFVLFDENNRGDIDIYRHYAAMILRERGL